MPGEKPITLTSRANDASMDELRLTNYRARLKDQHETELRDIQGKHDGDVMRALEQHADLMETLKRDYDVQISAQAQELEDRLHAQRLSAEERLSAEKVAAEKELAKVRTLNQKQIAHYQKNANERVETIRKQEQDATASLHARARKYQPKETEKA